MPGISSAHHPSFPIRAKGAEGMWRADWPSSLRCSSRAQRAEAGTSRIRFPSWKTDRHSAAPELECHCAKSPSCRLSQVEYLSIYLSMHLSIYLLYMSFYLSVWMSPVLSACGQMIEIYFFYFRERMLWELIGILAVDQRTAFFKRSEIIC